MSYESYEEAKQIGERIKSSTDLRDFIASEWGAPPKRVHNTWFWHTPFGEEHTPSFAVYPDHFKCFSTDSKPGDIFDVIDIISPGMNYIEKVAYLDKGIKSEAIKSLPKRTPQARNEERRIITASEIDYYHKHKNLIDPYLTKRKITDLMALEENRIGGERFKWHYHTIDEQQVIDTYFNRVSLPTMIDTDEGIRAFSINFRRDDLSCDVWVNENQEKYELVRTDLERIEQARPNPRPVTREMVFDALFGPRYWKPKKTRESLWGAHYLSYLKGDEIHYRKLPYAILSESVFDALSVVNTRFVATATRSNQLDLNRVFQNVNMVYIAMQNDANKAGEGHAHKFYEKLGQNKDRVRLMMLPEGVKDINDLLIAGELEAFLSEYPYCLNRALW